MHVCQVVVVIKYVFVVVDDIFYLFILVTVRSPPDTNRLSWSAASEVLKGHNHTNGFVMATW